jgi:hypothetical protein
MNCFVDLYRFSDVLNPVFNPFGADYEVQNTMAFFNWLPLVVIQ